MNGSKALNLTLGASVTTIFTAMFSNTVLSSSAGQYVFGTGSQSPFWAWAALHALFALAYLLGDTASRVIWGVGGAFFNAVSAFVDDHSL